MRNRSSRSAILLAVALLQPGLAAAQKLDKDDKKWLDDVRPILTADEERTFKGLKEKGDRLEFHPGDVSETLPRTETGPLSLAPMDLNASAPTESTAPAATAIAPAARPPFRPRWPRPAGALWSCTVTVR